jgi:hypothetical protein
MVRLSDVRCTLALGDILTIVDAAIARQDFLGIDLSVYS